MNHHLAFNMPYRQQPWRRLTAAKTFIDAVLFVKTIAFFIVVFHKDSLGIFLFEHIEGKAHSKNVLQIYF